MDAQVLESTAATLATAEQNARDAVTAAQAKLDGLNGRLNDALVTADVSGVDGLHAAIRGARQELEDAETWLAQITLRIRDNNSQLQMAGYARRVAEIEAEVETRAAEMRELAGEIKAESLAIKAALTRGREHESAVYQLRSELATLRATLDGSNHVDIHSARQFPRPVSAVAEQIPGLDHLERWNGAPTN